MTIQVLVQAREHLIKKTFEAIRGAKNVILHFYNSTSTLQRKVVFHMDTDGITKIATDAADLIYEMSQPLIQEGMNLRFEYSPSPLWAPRWTTRWRSARLCWSTSTPTRSTRSF